NKSNYVLILFLYSTTFCKQFFLSGYPSAGVLHGIFFAEIPDNEYIEYFGPDYTLKVPNLNMDNLNSKTYLSSIKVQVMESLRAIQHAPGVQMQEVPPDFYVPDFDEDELDPDERVDQHTQDKQVHRDDEYYEGDNDNDHDDGGH
uniref:Histone deacetylase n=1 Tax=Aegilops tauschii subsp. strangulata TaxID=200361 RepID=A0A453BXL8_AEGTS